MKYRPILATAATVLWLVLNFYYFHLHKSRYNIPLGKMKRAVDMQLTIKRGTREISKHFSTGGTYYRTTPKITTKTAVVEEIYNRTISRECEIVLNHGPKEIRKLKNLNSTWLDVGDKPMKWVEMRTDEEIMKLTSASLRKIYGFDFDDASVSEEEMKFPIAFTILMHKNLHQTALLLGAIYRPHNIYCIHLDRKAPQKLQNSLNYFASQFSNVHVASMSIDVTYASVSRLMADLSCMKELLSITKNKWEYLINLCGQDFPLMTNLQMVRQLKQLNHSNFIHGTNNLPYTFRKRTKFVHEIITSVDGRGQVQRHISQTTKLHSPPPFNLTVVKNLAYNFYTRRFVEWAIYGEVGKVLLNWSVATYSPDEHFWLMLNFHPSAPGGSQTIPSYDLARYILWTGKGNSKNTSCAGKIVRGICVFTSGDVCTIIRRNKRAFFANKFDAKLDSAAIQCLRYWLDEKSRSP